jgi:hypothetical protein
MCCGRVLAMALTVLPLAACGRSDDTAAPGDVTVSEAKALDEAAEMIEAHRPPPPAVNPSAPLPPDVPAPLATKAAR